MAQSFGKPRILGVRPGEKKDTSESREERMLMEFREDVIGDLL